MSVAIGSIVVGVADAADDPHLERAVRLAERLRARLHVVHAYHLPDPALYPHVEMSVFGAHALQDIQHRVQRLLDEQVRKLTTSSLVTARALPVPAAIAILETAHSENADLIMLGATHHGAVARAILGTTAQRVLRGAPVPVLVTRGHDGAPKRVLFTTDLSELSAHVLDRASALVGSIAAESAESRSLLVVSYDVPLLVPMEPGGLAEAGSRELARFLEQAGPMAARTKERVRVGDPSHEIAAEADEWEADLLVLGTHGRSGVSRFLIGSVAESVLGKVHCSVLVIPSSSVSAAAMRSARVPAPVSH